MMKKKQVIGLLILLTGIIILATPFSFMLKDDWTQYKNGKAYQIYQSRQASQLEKRRQALEDAEVSSNGVQDIFRQDKTEAAKQISPYSSIFDTNKMVGRMSIPVLGQNFDLYLDADYEKLLKGVATLVGTSAPLGIKGQRPIIAGHRINYNGMSFYFLPSLKKGDRIYISILDQNLEYEVTDSQIIGEYETEKLAPISDKDMITLMTCVNAPSYNQRLLVNAKRVTSNSSNHPTTARLGEFIKNKKVPLSFKLQRLLPYLIVLICLLGLLFFGRKLWQVLHSKSTKEDAR